MADASEELNPDRRRRLGAGLLLGVLALVAVGREIMFGSMDPDLFWHVRVGEQLLRDGIGPLVDGLSFASIRRPWAPYSWLAELGMHWIWTYGGYRAALAGAAGLAAGVVATLGLIALAARKPSGSYLGVVVLSTLGALLMIRYLSFRPATMAIALCGIALWLLVRDARLAWRSRAVWAIVPIAALMTNIHLYALLVPMATGAMALGALWARGKLDATVARLAALTAGALLACAATPMLAGLIQTALHYQYADPMVAGGGIQEMKPLWSNPMGAVLGIAQVALIALALRRRRQIEPWQWLWLAMGVALGVRFGRFAPLYVMLSMPALMRGFPSMKDTAIGRWPVHAVAAALLLLGALRLWAAFPDARTSMADWLGRSPTIAQYPCHAADWVQRHVTPRQGRLVNEFTWGGYLAWHLGDRWQVLVDGRTQLYADDFWQALYLGDQSARREYLSRVRADAAILPIKDSDFLATLEALGWRRAYQDRQAQVLVPPEADAGAESAQAAR